MTTEKKVESIRWWVEEVKKTPGCDIASDTNLGVAAGMLHAWSMDGSIDFETSEVLRTEINNARQGI